MMANSSSSSTIQPDPLNNDDPFFLAYLSELGKWDNLVKDRSFMEVLKDDGGNDIQDGSDDDKGENDVEPHTRKKSRIAADASDGSSGSNGESDTTGGSSVSGGSTVASVPTDRSEAVSLTPEDMELANLPPQLYHAFGTLDMKLLRRLVDTSFDENCINATTTEKEPIVGRDHFFNMMSTMADRTPDAIHAVRNSRVVKDAAGNKAVKFKVFTTATYIKDKNDGNDLAPNLQATTVADHLDESSITKQEIASIKESCAATDGPAPLFSILSYCSCCWHLNGEGKVRHVDAQYKLLSMKPVSQKLIKG